MVHAEITEENIIEISVCQLQSSGKNYITEFCEMSAFGMNLVY